MKKKRPFDFDLGADVETHEPPTPLQEQDRREHFAALSRLKCEAKIGRERMKKRRIPQKISHRVSKR